MPEYHRGRLFDHVHLRVRELEASRRFYKAVIEAVGLPRIDSRPWATTR